MESIANVGVINLAQRGKLTVLPEWKGPIVELIPAERDKSAATMYKFMRWFLRKHRKEIRDKAKNAIFMMLAYGEGAMNQMYEDKTSTPNESKSSEA